MRQIVNLMNLYIIDNDDNVVRLKAAYCDANRRMNYDSIKTGITIRNARSDGKTFKDWTIEPSTGFYYGVEWDLFLVATYLEKAGGKVFYCNSRPLRWEFATAGHTNNWSLTASSYGLGYAVKSAGRLTAKVSSVVNPSGLATLSETCHYLQMAPGSTWSPPNNHVMSFTQLDPKRDFYHAMKNNTSFLDGHIDSFSRAEFLSKGDDFYYREPLSGKFTF